MSLLQIDALCVKLQSVEVLRGISLALAHGEMIGLLGRNGAGKTTTLRAVMGLVVASGGRITYAGEDLITLPTHRRAALGIGYMPEDRRLVPRSRWRKMFCCRAGSRAALMPPPASISSMASCRKWRPCATARRWC